MAAQYDLWLTAAGRVYRAVPYEVLADWLQQGRVVLADKLRPVGAADWKSLSDFPQFTVYLPRAGPARADDSAEAMEPVSLDLPTPAQYGGEDEDVDMIPLIDISLVLLIFFMMTTTVAVAGSGILTPETRFAILSSDANMLWVGIDRGPGGAPVYSVGEENRPAADENQNLTEAAVVERVTAMLRGRKSDRGVTIRVAGHFKLPFETIQHLTAEMSKLRPLGVIDVKADVREKSQ